MISLKSVPRTLAVVSAASVALLTTLSMRTRGDDKDFRPIVEAEMPEGFPDYTGVGVVKVKEYPEYRRAVAETGRSSAFWTLFSHIKKNKIAMTAPVEMSYDAEDPSDESMSFLYGSQAMGETGRQGNVEVVDVTAMTVVSTGVRGPRRSKTVDEARARLAEWLIANKDRYVADGEYRVMGYNSPFVPRSKNYFEVEIPIRPVE